MNNNKPRTLRLILGDQLNYNHSWFKKIDPDVCYCMFEMRQETDYVRHHIQKVVAFFSAMRAFSLELQKSGHNVIYFKIDDCNNCQSLESNLNKLINDFEISHFEYIEPDEYRLDLQLKNYTHSLGINHKAVDSEHFIVHRYYLEENFGKRDSYLMESFYRSIRKYKNILMQDDEPLGGKWNYDVENRKALPKNVDIEEIDLRSNEIDDVLKVINEAGIQTFGEIDPQKFYWPVTRSQALEVLNKFLERGIVNFGSYQDAMHTRYKFLYHSRLSFALNVKLISPSEVVDATLSHWDSHPEIEISQIEGFIRQIIGWREYMRCIYWRFMPDYKKLNYFSNQGQLPSWFWDGKTKMNCLNHCIKQSLTDAYAHHIQRLMVIGNFALLAGISPDEVDEWYLGIYIDAIEWVEITNTRGMSQFADGGIVGTKPYVSSASYINKMSNYCSKCYYNHKTKFDQDSCPFNTLYWNFFNINQDKLRKIHRLRMMYSVWDKMADSEQQAISKKADSLLSIVNDL